MAHFGATLATLAHRMIKTSVVSEAEAENPKGLMPQLDPEKTLGAIEELKRRGKEQWGASYYSQLAPSELCELAGRPRAVQYGALISWLKRLGEGSKKGAPKGALALAAELTGSSPADCTRWAETSPQASSRQQASPTNKKSRDQLQVNCPSIVHDYRFVVVGELPDEQAHAAVLIQPVDGTGYFYPQVARHNPLRAGRAFACFVQLGNPAGIWHIKPPPFDAKVRVLALERPWDTELCDRLLEEELDQLVAQLGLIAQHDTMTSRVSTDPLVPTLHDGADHSSDPLRYPEPQPRTCVAPLTLNWKGGAAYIEVRGGDGDRVLFQGTAASGAVVTMRGRSKPEDKTRILCELDAPGRYRLRMYPALKSFVDPPYEWWLDLC